MIEMNDIFANMLLFYSNKIHPHHLLYHFYRSIITQVIFYFWIISFRLHFFYFQSHLFLILETIIIFCLCIFQIFDNWFEKKRKAHIFFCNLLTNALSLVPFLDFAKDNINNNN